jgi:hypothetical protein
MRSVAYSFVDHLARGCRGVKSVPWWAVGSTPSLTPHSKRYRFISRDSLPPQIPHSRSNHMLQGFDGRRCVPLACSLRRHSSRYLHHPTNPLSTLHSTHRLPSEVDIL